MSDSYCLGMVHRTRQSSSSANIAIAIETVNSGSIPGWIKPNTIKIGIHNFPARRSAIKRDSVKPPSCLVDRWAGGSLTRKPKDLYLSKTAVYLSSYLASWPRQLNK